MSCIVFIVGVPPPDLWFASVSPEPQRTADPEPDPVRWPHAHPPHHPQQVAGRKGGALLLCSWEGWTFTPSSVMGTPVLASWAAPLTPPPGSDLGKIFLRTLRWAPSRNECPSLLLSLEDGLLAPSLSPPSWDRG